MFSDYFYLNIYKLKQLIVVRYLVFILAILLSFSVSAQNEMLIDSLEQAVQEEHDVARKIDLYINLVEVMSPSNPDRASELAQDVLELAKSLDNNEMIGHIHFLLGDIEFIKDDVDASVEEYMLALQYLEETEAYELLIRAHTALGNRFVEKGNYPAAMDHYLSGIRISEESGSDQRLSNIYNNLGVVYINLNNPQKALELYSQALTLFEGKNDTVNVAGTTTNMGSIYIQLGNYEIARQYYSSGLKLFEKIGMLAGMAHANFKLGLLDEMEGNYENAIDYLQRSLDLQRSVEISPSGSRTLFEAETFLYMGISYFGLNNISKAEDYIEDGYQIAKDFNHYELISLAADYLSRIARSKRNFESALDFHIIHKQYSDSLYNEENVRKLTQLELQHQYESQLTQARLEKEVEEQKRKQNNLYYFILTGGLLLVLVIIALLLKLEKNKKNKVELERSVLEEKLEHTNKELTTYVMYLLRKNEFILSIIEKLKKARIDATKENKKVIAELISELQSNADTVSWEEFELRFQEVHTDFYTNLHKKHPDLTNNEIRLCAFFRLNMTSKEIAAITYQSLNSIKVARYRLRKKLNLNQEDSLITFLSGF